MTGNFSADLNDDINDFTAEQHAGVVRWRKFYQTHKVQTAWDDLHAYWIRPEFVRLLNLMYRLTVRWGEL